MNWGEGGWRPANVRFSRDGVRGICVARLGHQGSPLAGNTANLPGGSRATRTRRASCCNVPKAYLVPASKPEVIERLRWHGIHMQTLAEPATLQICKYRLVDPQPDATPYEGRYRSDHPM